MAIPFKIDLKDQVVVVTGGSGVASYSTTDSSAANVLPADAPIVPWIVAPISNDDNVFFPGAATDGTRSPSRPGMNHLTPCDSR